MRIALGLLISLLAASALAADYVRPYVRKDGTYVEGHYRSSPNNTKMDNYSTQGNTNPYTGQRGTVDPYAVQPNPYRQPKRGYQYLP
jgi:hypothetical protein